MADYFTNVSFVVEMSEGRADWLIGLHEEVIQQSDSCDEEKPAVKPEYESVIGYFRDEEYFGGDCCVDLEFMEYDDKPALWVNGESVNCDYVAALMQAYLREFDLDQYITFEWSNDCSKPRTDAYGGGAMIVTKDSIEGMTTGGWLYDRVQAMNPTA